MSPAERTTPGPRGGRRPITFFCQGGAGTRRPRGGDRDFVPGAAASLGVTAPARGAEGELESVRGVQGSGGGAGPGGGLRPAAAGPEVGRSQPAAWAAAALCARTRVFLFLRRGAVQSPGVTWAPPRRLYRPPLGCVGLGWDPLTFTHLRLMLRADLSHLSHPFLHLCPTLARLPLSDQSNSQMVTVTPPRL